VGSWMSVVALESTQRLPRTFEYCHKGRWCEPTCRLRFTWGLVAVFFASLALQLGLRTGSCDSGMNVWGLHPEAGGFRELFWSGIHWLGFRNVGMLLTLVPGYSRTYFAAGRHSGQSGPACAITVDDGVGKDFTHFEQLLDFLKSESVHATFFVIGNGHTTGDSGARLLRRAVQDGHEIGNHGLADAAMTTMSGEAFDLAVEDWERRIRAILPQWPVRQEDYKWFRAPKGLMNSKMAAVLERRGYQSALGDIYSDDWAINDAAFHANVLANVTSDGSVIILHAPDRPDRFQTLDILRMAIPLLQARGFRFARMTELFSTSVQEEPACSRCVVCGVGLLGTGLPLLVILLGFIFVKVSRCLWRLPSSAMAKLRQVEPHAVRPERGPSV